LLKDSVPCPIPNGEKDAHRAPSSLQTFTDDCRPFNKLRRFVAGCRLLCPKAVAQMTRFGPASSQIDNHDSQCGKPGTRKLAIQPLLPSESGSGNNLDTFSSHKAWSNPLFCGYRTKAPY
jgi:hypothetical protein